MRRSFASSPTVLVILGLLGCGGTAAAILRATVGTTAATPTAAITEMQRGSAELEEDIQSPAAMDLGMEVMGAVCNASAEDTAYCSDDRTYVECDNGAWKSIDCGTTPQYCGELNGTVGCYSMTNNDPDPGPDPVEEVDAASSDQDAATPPMCPMVAGTYNFVSVTGACGDMGPTVFTQDGCEISGEGGVLIGTTTYTLNASGSTADCAMSDNCWTFSGNMATYAVDPCIYVFMR